MASHQDKVSSSNKTWGIAAVLVAVVAGIGYFTTQYPPRYQGEQITADDVKLGDQSVQQFMQTDLFTQLQQDEALREALSSEALREAMNNEAFREALNSEAFREALNSEAAREALKSETVREAFSNEAPR